MTILNVVLWIAQGLLAVVFLISGLARVFGSKTWLLQRGQTDVLRYESPMIHLIGALELIATLALILP